MREIAIGADTLLSAALAERDGWEVAGGLIEDALRDEVLLVTSVADLIEFDRVARPLLGDGLCDAWLGLFSDGMRVVPVTVEDLASALRHPGGTLLGRLDAAIGTQPTDVAASLLGLDSRSFDYSTLDPATREAEEIPPRRRPDRAQARKWRRG